jgi:hypothetical protein
MAGASWVHRDLGVSNVYGVNGQLKLGYLEYATRFGAQSGMDAHDLKTVSRRNFFPGVKPNPRIGNAMVLVC